LPDSIGQLVYTEWLPVVRNTVRQLIVQWEAEQVPLPGRTIDTTSGPARILKSYLGSDMDRLLAGWALAELLRKPVGVNDAEQEVAVMLYATLRLPAEPAAAALAHPSTGVTGRTAAIWALRNSQGKRIIADAVRVSVCLVAARQQGVLDWSGVSPQRWSVLMDGEERRFVNAVGALLGARKELTEAIPELPMDNPVRIALTHQYLPEP
jgi:hypothetical protein